MSHKVMGTKFRLCMIQSKHAGVSQSVNYYIKSDRLKSDGYLGIGDIGVSSMRSVGFDVCENSLHYFEQMAGSHAIWPRIKCEPFNATQWRNMRIGMSTAILK